MAIAVVSGRVYGMCMVRGDVVFGKIGADGSCWFRWCGSRAVNVANLVGYASELPLLAPTQREEEPSVYIEISKK